MDHVQRVGSEIWSVLYSAIASTAFDGLAGDIVSVNVFGQTVVVLNRLEDAVALFEKRSVNYSGRPPLVVAGEMIGWN